MKKQLRLAVISGAEIAETRSDEDAGKRAGSTPWARVRAHAERQAAGRVDAMIGDIEFKIDGRLVGRLEAHLVGRDPDRALRDMVSEWLTQQIEALR